MASLSGLLSLGCNNNTHSVQATEQLFDKCILLSRPATGTLHPLNRSQSYQHQVAHAEGINIVAYWAARNTIYIFNEHRPSPIFTSISASITASQEASEFRIRTSAAVEQGSTPWWRISFGPLVKQVPFYQLCINESSLLFFGLRQFARA